MTPPAKIDRLDFISRCTSCGATFYEGPNGARELRNGCGDPCSFTMAKSGAGEPPFLSPEAIVREIAKLMQRRSSR